MCLLRHISGKLRGDNVSCLLYIKETGRREHCLLRYISGKLKAEISTRDIFTSCAVRGGGDMRGRGGGGVSYKALGNPRRGEGVRGKAGRGDEEGAWEERKGRSRGIFF